MEAKWTQSNSIYKRPISVFKKFGCYFRLKFDSALGGECHGCEYCYRTNLLNRMGMEGNKKYAFVSYLEEAFEKSEQSLHDQKRERPEDIEVFKLIKNRMPIRLGSMCDPFEPDDKVRETSTGVIDLLNRQKHPYMIFTKSDHVASPEILGRLRESDQNVLVHMSLSNMDNEKGLVMEPKAPSCTQRFMALKAILNEGVPVVLRIAPIILGFNDKDVIPLIQAFKSIGGHKVIIEDLRAGAEFKEYLEKNHPKVMNYFSNEMEWNYYRYDDIILYPYFKKYVSAAKDLGLEVAICGNRDLEKELCNNQNCCLFDSPPMMMR